MKFDLLLCSPPLFLLLKDIYRDFAGGPHLFPFFSSFNFRDGIREDFSSFLFLPIFSSSF